MGVTFSVTPLQLVTDRREALNSSHFTVKLRRQEERRGLMCGPSGVNNTPEHSQRNQGWVGGQGAVQGAIQVPKGSFSHVQYKLLIT